MSQRDPSRLGRRLEALAEASAARGDVTRSLLEYEDAIDAHAADRDWPSADATAAIAIALGRTHGVDMTAAIARRATLASRFERPEARALWLEVDAAAQACGDDRLRAQALVHAARTERADCELLLEAASLDPATNGWAARAANIIAMASADWDAAARHARVAGDLAREARDRNLEAQAAWGLSLATGNLGDDAAALEACRRAIYLLSELHETAQAEYARAGYVDLLAEALRLGDAETESRHLLFTTQAAGLDELTPIAVALRALTLLRAGRLDEAHELLLAQGCPDAGLDQRALLAVVAAHVAVDRSGPSMDALAAVDAADAACDAAGIETYAIEAGIARIALDLASGIDDEALGTARALRLTEPLAAGRLALLLARHASVEGTACDRLVGDLARVLATSSSPWAELGGAELAAHAARDADALRACAARWRAAGFLLDAARVDHAAVRTEVRARRRDVHTDTMLGLVAEFGRAGARADADRVARALRGSSRHSVAGHQAALVALRSPLLVGLSDEARREIARACTCTSLRRGQSLAGAGTSWSGDGLLLVVAGRVRLSSTAPSGKVLAVDVLDPGAVWGADLRDDALDAPLEATATEASEVAVLQRATLEALVDRHPQLGLNLSRVLADGLVRARTMSQQLAYWSVEDRFSSLLLDFDARYGETSADGSRRLGKRFAQGELAELIGTRRETVNQLLVELRRHGIVTTDDDQHLVITDETMLRARVAGR